MLDEPASNLHQTAQAKLRTELQTMVSDCKLIYSTHSHHLISPKWLADTYIVKNSAIDYSAIGDELGKETHITAIPYRRFVAEHPNERDHFQPIFDALDYRPSDLEMVPPIVITEGKTDYYVMKYFCDVIFQGKYSLHFYPGAGLDKFDDPFRLYLAWGVDFHALFDADEAGRRAKLRYIDEIGPDVEPRIHLLSEVGISPKPKILEDLFSETEKLKVTQTLYPETDSSSDFDKSRFHLSIQNLYSTKQSCSFNRSTEENFRRIFDFLHSKFSPSP